MAEITNYKVAASPHKLDRSNTRRIMLDVLIALAPGLVCGVLFYGLYALMLVAICVAACFASEQVYNLIRKKPFTFDLSAVVTGVILGLNLPPRAPWYIPIVGGVFAIVVVKMIFGGLGKNFANPAATARVFLLLAYSSVMTQYIGADLSNVLAGDVTTGATYLGGGIAALQDSFLNIGGYWGYVLQLLFGYVGGSIGETCKLAVLAGGVYLTARRVIDWRIPVVYLLTAAAMVLVCYGSASEILLQLFSGGLMFGAVFMATDYATSPKWRYNRVLYAIGLGVITVLIRRYGSYPEGTSLAILIMNLFVPIMDKYLLPVRFGQTSKSGKPKPKVMKWAMRCVCIALAAAIAVAVPLVNYTEVQLYTGRFSYVTDAKREFGGGYVFSVEGEAYLDQYDYTQPLAYEIKLNAEGDKVLSVRPITQSTMGYVANLAFFEGKTYDEIAALTDLSTDAETSATYTNTALRKMILECFTAYDANIADYSAISASGEHIVKAERCGDLYRFTLSGVADLAEYNYQQPLAYAITIDAAAGKVKYITTINESTYGYTVDREIFVGKTAEEIAAMTDETIASDITTGATITNAAVRDLIGECFAALEGAAKGGAE